MHNPAELEIQQERKRFLPSQHAACRSERMEERQTDGSRGEEKTGGSTRARNAGESKNHCV